MKKYLTIGKYLLPALFLMAVIAVVDQVSKWFVTQKFISPEGHVAVPFFDWIANAPATDLTTGDYQPVRLASFLDITMVWNRGVSFGLFSSGGDMMPVALTVMAVIVSLGLLFWLSRTNDGRLATALGLVIGGAIGNVFDRVRFGAVIDFIDMHAYGVHWPAFNVADCAIVFGAGLIMLDAISAEKKG